MKIPEIFVIERTEASEKIKKHVKKEHKHDLEDFIIDKKIMGCERFSIYDIDTTNPEFLHVRGIGPEVVEKAVFANYDESTVLMVQYKTQEDITKNLRKLFKKGILFYENHREGEFIEIFLFKNNIAVYLQGCGDFNKKAAKHYRNLGFKQLEYELKGV